MKYIFLLFLIIIPIIYGSILLNDFRKKYTLRGVDVMEFMAGWMLMGGVFILPVVVITLSAFQSIILFLLLSSICRTRYEKLGISSKKMGMKLIISEFGFMILGGILFLTIRILLTSLT